MPLSEIKFAEAEAVVLVCFACFLKLWRGDARARAARWPLKLLKSHQSGACRHVMEVEEHFEDEPLV